MEAFDPELYLRLVGERLVLSSDTRSGFEPDALTEAAAALHAVGAVDRNAAGAIVDEYSAALVLRGREPGYFHRLRHRGRASQGETKPLPTPVIAPVGETVELPAGSYEVRYARFDKDATALGVTIRRASTPRRGGFTHVSIHGPAAASLSPAVADDQGTVGQADFGGGGSDEELTGHLHVTPPLSPATRWLELDGVRVDVGRPVQPPDVTIETVPSSRSPALEHLWQHVLISGPFAWSDAGIEPAVDALAAAGALARDDPELAELQAVMTRLGPGYQHSTSGRAGKLPEPWASMFARRARADGPVGGRPIAATTPVFAGLAVAVIWLESGPEAFRVEVEVAGPVAVPDEFDEEVRGTPVIWWARDDRGNTYLGQPMSSSGEEGRTEAELHFWPALDPAATLLELLPTAGGERAVVPVPLEWQDAAASGS